MRRLLPGQSTRLLATTSRGSVVGQRHWQQSQTVRPPLPIVALRHQNLRPGFPPIGPSRRLFCVKAEAKKKDSTVEDSTVEESEPREAEKASSSEGDAEKAGSASSESKAAAAEDAEKADEDGAKGEAKEEKGAEEKAPEEEAKLSPAAKLQKELEELTKKASEKQHQVLLKLADFENEKRSNQKIVKQRETLTMSNFSREMITVFEELDEATKIGQSQDSPECVETLREGVELTRDIFLKTLEKFGCQRQTVERGSPYNSLEQESVKEVEVADLPADVVAEVLAPGWSFDSKVLQKAKVAVTKSGPPTPPAPPQATEGEAPTDTNEGEAPTDTKQSS